jgi:hypothetical protein
MDTNVCYTSWIVSQAGGGHPAGSDSSFIDWASRGEQVALADVKQRRAAFRCRGESCCIAPCGSSHDYWPDGSDVSFISNGCGMQQRGTCGFGIAAKLDALGQELPVLGSTADPSFMEKMLLASSYLSTARRHVQRNFRTPMSLPDASALSGLLKSIGDLLALESIAEALRRPISGQNLIDIGYQLLDMANEYFILAQHFYSKEVRAARIERPSDAVEAEIAAVSRKAASLKADVIDYLKRAEETLENLKMSR